MEQNREPRNKYTIKIIWTPPKNGSLIKLHFIACRTPWTSLVFTRNSLFPPNGFFSNIQVPFLSCQSDVPGRHKSFFSVVLFLKLYFIDHAITVAPIFPPFPLSTQHLPLPQTIPTALFMYMGHACKFFGYSISYSTLYIPMAIL